MKVAFVFDHFGPYHLARISAAAKLPEWDVWGIELHPKSRTYAWDSSKAAFGFKKISLPNVPATGSAERFALLPHLERALASCLPDVVFVNGWGDFMSLETIRWAKKQGVRLVVMSETRRVDGKRSWWGEWVKSRLVSLCDAGLCGGESHRRYLGDLGLTKDRVALGYNAVDNEFFAVAKKSGSQVDGILGGTTKGTNLHEWGGGSREIRRESGITTTDQGEIDCRRQLRRSERSESKDTESTTEQRGRCDMEQPKVGPKGTQVAREAARESAEGSPSGARRAGASESTLGAGATESEEEAGARLSGQAGAAFSNPLTSEPAGDCENSSLNRSAIAPSHATRHSQPATAPEALAGPYFLASNRFVERKNLEQLIRAYARYVGSLQEGKKAWPMVLLGDGELRGKLEALCGELGINVFSFQGSVFSREKKGDLKLNSYKLKTPAEGGCVIFAGFRQVEELPFFYAGAGAFIHPAVSEPWGLVINEAMASRLPILSSGNVGAAEELVQEGVNGFSFNPDDVEGLAELMAQMAGMSVVKRLAMGRASERSILEWGPERFARGAQEAVHVAMSAPTRCAGIFDRFLLEMLIRK